MTTYAPRPIQSASSERGSVFGQLLVALLGGMALFGALLLLIPVIYDLTYADKIYPGVSVAGIDMSGLTAQEAAARLVQAIDYPTRGQVAFVEGANVWVAHPNELGLYLDYPTSAQAAYDYGRTGGLFARWEAQYRAWSLGVDLPVRFLLDERTAHQYLSALAAQIDRPIIEATLSVSGIDVVVRPGQVGRSVDVEAALNELRLLLPTLTDGLIALRVNETPPIILDATAQAELARQILSAPLTITVPNAVQGDPGPWTFDQAALAAMLTIQRVDTPQGAIYQVGLNSEPMRAFLESTVPLFARAPANAQFIFNDETKQLDRTKNAVIGRALDVEATLKAINQQVVAGAHSVPMSMVYTNPALTDDATGASLGITQLVSSQTTYFYGSSASRIQNIQTASARFHGVMVPPGATFSMAEVLGEVSLDTGYAEALIIYGNRTIQGVGGGVCQVSTTLFRTVFFGGYPVVERYAHAYRVGYYEQTASGGHDPRLAGLDATVFAPVVDFKFTNDTPYWLLMETYVNVEARTLTWKFYSTSDGRTVDWYTTGPENLVEPPEPLYEENPDLAKGVIKQVDWEAQGADITVTRTVYRNGQIVASDTFTTHYVPWRAVFQYGPGTKVPTPEP